MKLTFLGTGSFFVTGDNYHTNILLEDEEGHSFLIDCGTDIKRSLDAAGKDPSKIEGVYISHMHGDHAGGLEWLGFYSYFVTKKRPKLYTDTVLMDRVWNMLSPGMKCLDNKNAELSTYFEPCLCLNDRLSHYSTHEGPKFCFSWRGIGFNIVTTRHITTTRELKGTRVMADRCSFGLDVTVGQKRVWITTDSCEANYAKVGYPIDPHYYISDLIFHDCETFECSTVHSHYSKLKEFSSEIKKNMWLVHYQEIDDMPDAKADGFKGFVKRGQEFQL
jgi:ribonuclease BN (tRNA processing enzyme)